MSSANDTSTLLFAPVAGILFSTISILTLRQTGNAASSGSISPSWIQAGATVLSVGLTIGLLYLYHKQRELNALEYEATVQMEGHRPSDDGTLLDLCLSNLGRGVATDLLLRVDASFPDADDCIGGTIEMKPKKRLQQPDGDDIRNEWARPERNYIGPERYFVRFWTTGRVRWTDSDGTERKSSLAALPGHVPDSVDRVRLTITLDYQDQSGNDESERIVDDVLPLKSDADLEFLFSRGMTHDQYEQRKKSDVAADPFESLVVHRPQLIDECRTDEPNSKKNR